MKLHQKFILILTVLFFSTGVIHSVHSEPVKKISDVKQLHSYLDQNYSQYPYSIILFLNKDENANQKVVEEFNRIKQIFKYKDRVAVVGLTLNKDYTVQLLNKTRFKINNVPITVILQRLKQKNTKTGHYNSVEIKKSSPDVANLSKSVFNILSSFDSKIAKSDKKQEEMNKRLSSGYIFYEGFYFKTSSKSKIPHGKGYQYYYNEKEKKFFKIAKGIWNNGVRHGYFIQYSDSGKISFKGRYKNGKKERYAQEYYDGIRKFTGYYKNGKRDGKGTKYHYNGKVEYKGNFKNGKYQGYAILYNSSGRIKYKGYFEDGKYHGKGTLYKEEYDYKTKTRRSIVVYRGEFKNGRYHGEGTSYFSNGIVYYTGGWHEGYYHGLGKKYNRVGEIEYSGHYNKGYKHGEGTEYHHQYKQKIIKYHGRFKDGKYHGKGIRRYCFIDLKYRKYIGEFKDGKSKVMELSIYITKKFGIKVILKMEPSTDKEPNTTPAEK